MKINKWPAAVAWVAAEPASNSRFEATSENAGCENRRSYTWYVAGALSVLVAVYSRRFYGWCYVRPLRTALLRSTQWALAVHTSYVGYFSACCVDSAVHAGTPELLCFVLRIAAVLLYLQRWQSTSLRAGCREDALECVRLSHRAPV